MASVKVFLRLDKINSEGKVPIYLRITKSRKSKCIALDVYVLSKDWNKQTGKVKSTIHNAAQINAYISSKVAEAERIALDLEIRSTFITSYDIKHKILGRAPADFFAYVENRKDIMNREYTIGTIRRYKCIVNKLRSFCKRDLLYFDDINVLSFCTDSHWLTLIDGNILFINHTILTIETRHRLQVYTPKIFETSDLIRSFRMRPVRHPQVINSLQ